MNYQHLTTELERLKESSLRIKNEGEVLSSHWIDSTKARGKIYHRLRCWNGGRSEFVRTLKLEEVAEIKAMCDRARQLEKVNHSIRDVTAQIDRVVALVAELGVSVKILQNQN